MLYLGILRFFLRRLVISWQLARRPAWPSGPRTRTRTGRHARTSTGSSNSLERKSFGCWVTTASRLATDAFGLHITAGSNSPTPRDHRWSGCPSALWPSCWRHPSPFSCQRPQQRPYHRPQQAERPPKQLKRHVGRIPSWRLFATSTSAQSSPNGIIERTSILVLAQQVSQKSTSLSDWETKLRLPYHPCRPHFSASPYWPLHLSAPPSSSCHHEPQSPLRYPLVAPVSSYLEWPRYHPWTPLDQITWSGTLYGCLRVSWLRYLLHGPLDFRPNPGHLNSRTDPFSGRSFTPLPLPAYSGDNSGLERSFYRTLLSHIVIGSIWDIILGAHLPLPLHVAGWVGSHPTLAFTYTRVGMHLTCWLIHTLQGLSLLPLLRYLLLLGCVAATLVVLLIISRVCRCHHYCLHLQGVLLPPSIYAREHPMSLVPFTAKDCVVCIYYYYV